MIAAPLEYRTVTTKAPITLLVIYPGLFRIVYLFIQEGIPLVSQFQLHGNFLQFVVQVIPASLGRARYRFQM